MKRILLLLGIITVFSMTSCSDEQLIDSQDNVNQKSSSEAICGEAKVVDLIAGQHINVGTVSVSNSESTLYVTYETSGNWYLTETHVYVGPEADIPYNKQGNPKFGHFPYSQTHDNLQSYTYEIDLADLDECFAVVTHAVVDKIIDGEVVQGDETAFGCGDKEFPGNRWGCYFDYCKQECEDDDCLGLFGKKDNDTFTVCNEFNIGGNVQTGWASWLPYSLLYDEDLLGERHDYEIYRNTDGCDDTNGIEIGRVEFNVAGASLADGFNVVYNIYNIEFGGIPDNPNPYLIYEISLYVGPSDNPYNADGSLKPGVDPASVHTQVFDTPIKKTEVINMPWTGDMNLDPDSRIYMIPFVKVCDID